MEEDLNSYYKDKTSISKAIIDIGDALPTLGFAAAVLGIVISLGSVEDPTNNLIILVVPALVSIFIGIFLSYSVISPIGHLLENYFYTDLNYLRCIKNGIIAHMQVQPPKISLESSRKSLSSEIQPTREEVEKIYENLSV
jgi:chemotaxis protein MotA